MNLLKNIFIDILGKRNNNVLFNTWNAKEKTCITNLNGSYDLLIFDFDNRLGDSIYLALFISEISNLNYFNNIYVFTNNNNIIYKYLNHYHKNLFIVNYKSYLSLLLYLFKFKNNKIVSVNLDPGIRVIYFLSLRILKLSLNIGFSKNIFNIIHINLNDISINYKLNHHLYKINEILSLFNNKYTHYEFHDYIFVKHIRKHFPLENNQLIFINCSSSDVNRQLDFSILKNIIEIVKNDFNEILIRYDNINNQKFELTKFTHCKLIYDNLNDLLNDLRKCRCLISVDTSFIHLASLLNIPTLSIYFDRHFNPYVWCGKMDNNNSVFISNLKNDCSLIINNFIKQYK